MSIKYGEPKIIDIEKQFKSYKLDTEIYCKKKHDNDLTFPKNYNV
jgi:hypothetical protein